MKQQPGRKSKNSRKAKAARTMRAVAIGIFCATLLAAAGSAALWAGGRVLASDAFRVTHVYVSGCGSDIAEEALAAAERFRDTNILSADLRELTREIEQIPWVQHATVKKQLPDTLAITIDVREARAIILLDKAYLVDQHGIIFIDAPEHWPSLPVLRGMTVSTVADGSDAAIPQIRAGLRIIRTLQKQDIPTDSNVRVTFDRELGFTVSTEPGAADIYLGFDDYEQKLAALPPLLTDLRSRGLRAGYIYLNSCERAYVAVENRNEAHRQAAAPSAPVSGAAS